MKHGPAWIIFEESASAHTRRLLSIQSPRRAERDVRAYMQQRYVDEHGSIGEKLSYKKSRRFVPFEIMRGMHANPLMIGHDPFFVGIYADQVIVEGGKLEFVYKILVSVDEKSVPRFERRQQTLAVPV
jgi:hypothetical protein